MRLLIWNNKKKWIQRFFIDDLPKMKQQKHLFLFFCVQYTVHSTQYTVHSVLYMFSGNRKQCWTENIFWNRLHKCTLFQSASNRHTSMKKIVAFCVSTLNRVWALGPIISKLFKVNLRDWKISHIHVISLRDLTWKIKCENN